MKTFNLGSLNIVILAIIIIGCNKPSANVSQIETSKSESNVVAMKSGTSESKNFIVNDTITLQSVVKSDDDWKSELNEMEYYVIREKGTERAFTGEYWDNKAKGIYVCKACSLPLYDSQTKFKSGTGWPSYYEAIDKSYILEDTDYDLGYPRTEIMCGRCEGHLGHVFSDGPQPTGKRHCVNSASIKFVAEDEVPEFIINIREHK